MHFCVIDCGQQADGTAGSQTPMLGGRSYFALDEILPPPGQDRTDSTGEESDDDGKTRRPNPRSSLMTKTGFWKFEWKLQMQIIRQ